ncbi:MAG: TonB-dependent receptor [Elusimicrobia bacterium]|nr:TonB-dependent receptor [Elusimicrobiota bacterium]
MNYAQDMMRTASWRLLVAVLIVFQSGTAGAAEDAFQIFEEKAKVVAVSRRPQTLTSYESGYRGSWLDRRLTGEASLYYTVIADIDDIVPAAAPGADTFGNVNGAIARGAELQLRYRLSSTRSFYANYTHERLSDAAGDLGRGFSGSCNRGYKDHYSISDQGQEAAIPAYWRLDVRLAHAFPGYTPRHAEFADALVVPRAVSGGVTVTFGGGL